MTTIPTLRLNDGHDLPALGFGTYPHGYADSERAVGHALELGYRLIDTALRYENEVEVGNAIRKSPVAREEIVLTSKLPGRNHGYDEAFQAFEESSRNLGLDTIDLYLIHWPLPKQGKYVDTWRALIELQKAGKVRSIGVSNFTEEHLKNLQDATGVTPAVNQVELHPYFPQQALREFHARNGIVTQSWSPLGRGELLQEPLLTELAEKYDVGVGQLVLRWHLQNGVVPIPMSNDSGRQQQNLEIFGFDITDEDLASINSLEKGRLWGQDPNEHEEF